MNTAIAQDAWYKHFWVWVLIALPSSAVIASLVTVWLVLQAPDPVINKEQSSQAVNDVLGRNSVAPPEK